MYFCASCNARRHNVILIHHIINFKYIMDLCFNVVLFIDMMLKYNVPRINLLNMYQSMYVFI